MFIERSWSFDFWRGYRLARIATFERERALDNNAWTYRQLQHRRYLGWGRRHRATNPESSKTPKR